MALRRKEDKNLPKIPVAAQELVDTALKLRFIGTYYSQTRFNDAKGKLFEIFKYTPDLELTLGEGYRFPNGAMLIATQKENEERVDTDKLLEMVESGDLSAKDLIAAGSFSVSKVKEVAPKAINVRPLTEEEQEISTVVTLRDPADLKTKLGVLAPVFDELFSHLDKIVKL